MQTTVWAILAIQFHMSWRTMARRAASVFGGALFAAVLPMLAFVFSAQAAAQPRDISGAGRAMETGILPPGRTALPPAPSAKNSTIFGGAIRNIDPVRDQFLLDIYGEHPMKVLFDERTKVYRDGVKIPVRELAAADHASVQTALDGSNIFAISIHILSSVPEGTYSGRVLRFKESTGELDLDAAPSKHALKIFVPQDASIVRKGQTAFTSEGSGRFDLRRGSLVDVTFAPGAGPLARATRIVVLAVPGSSFVFTGSITSLNEANGALVLADPRDGESYRIAFVPSAIPGSGNLRIGERVRITAEYDGTAYIATDIAAD